jgi:hypothetical protein
VFQYFIGYKRDFDSFNIRLLQLYFQNSSNRRNGKKIQNGEDPNSSNTIGRIWDNFFGINESFVVSFFLFELCVFLEEK